MSRTLTLCSMSLFLFQGKVRDIGTAGEYIRGDSTAYHYAESIGNEIVLIHPSARNKVLMHFVDRGEGYCENAC